MLNKIYLSLLIVVLVSIAAIYSDDDYEDDDSITDVCYKKSYGRGAGVVPSTCDDGEEKNGALCYDECKPGYKGVGPVCWEKCDDDFDDRGLICTRDMHVYGKGCCCIKIFGKKKCCNKCKDGYHDDGCTCRRAPKSYIKDSYTRGAGSTLSCKSGMEKDAGLCYKPCKSGYYGVGPVCYLKCNNLSRLKTDCGSLCAEDKATCGLRTTQLSLDGLTVATGDAGGVESYLSISVCNANDF